jgi:hypothetical protein
VPTSPTQVGAPTTGTWSTGQTFVDSNGAIWACSAGGTPGTWFAAGSGVELGAADLSADPAASTITTADVTGLSITFTAPARAFVVTATIPLVSVSATGEGLVAEITDSANVIVAQISMIGISYLGGFYASGSTLAARLPRTGGANAYAIVPGTSYTFKLRTAMSAGTGQIITASGQYRPILRAVTC